MKKYISMILASLMAVSCVDTLILPDDKTVEEDFWKSKADVQLMVNGAYQGMLSSAVISRLIVWSGLRSDELIPAATLTGTTVEDLTEINLANTQTDNTFAEWGSFYAVINRCNLVLDKAEGVMAEDPSYTEGDYLSDCSQMLALRSLCYFYLVRNFRDVPYITTAFTDSSQDRNVAQTAPDSVLAGCLNDLAIAEKNAISSSAFTDWRRVGYMTRDAINALQADIYLWKASISHNAADYEQAIAYCDKVIASKKLQHIKARGEVEEKEYWLAEGKSRQGMTAYNQLFIAGNAEESIFELQYDGSSNNNDGITNYYNHNTSNVNSVPLLYASSIFLVGSDVFTTINGATGAADWRAMTSTYNQTSAIGDFEGMEVRKYVSSNANYNPSSPVLANREQKSGVTYASTQARNFIVYRLTDIMLMKAEALVALATDNDDLEHLQAAFDLAREVHLRSWESEDKSVTWNYFRTSEDRQTALENFVLAERLRELCFEGKRWYDLLRYSFRHTEGIDYTTTLAEQAEKENATFAETSKSMLDLVKRKLGDKGNAVAAKMDTEPKLYMPIPMSDLNICPLLRQNPSYKNNDIYQKN